MRYAVLVSGPAGAGKSTFCNALLKHANDSKRNMHLFNLDPAADNFEYSPSVDIRDLISLDDVMDELELGPNGGLIYCFEYLIENLDWLDEQLDDYDEEYLLIDCPGQIELYTHYPYMTDFIRHLQRQQNMSVCATYLLDSQFMEDRSKFFSGVLSAMSCMVNLEIPHINILSKMDLVKGKPRDAELERFLEADPLLLVDTVNKHTSSKFHALNTAIGQLIEDFNMVQFFPLDITSEDSLTLILSNIDYSMQFGESEEPKDPKDPDEEEEEEEGIEGFEGF